MLSEPRFRAAVDLRSVVFTPLVGEGLVQQTTRRLAEAINIGLLTTGDRLPSENQLAGWLQVSPMTLRKALVALRAAGYIETRRGPRGGSFVTDDSASARGALEQLPTSIGQGYLRDLKDFRRAIASHAAALAAGRAGSTDLGELIQFGGQSTSVPGALSYLQREAQFHIHLARASGSRHLWQQQTIIEMDLNGLVLDSHPVIDAMSISELLAEQDALLGAVREQQPEQARTLASQHADRASDTLLSLVSGGAS